MKKSTLAKLEKEVSWRRTKTYYNISDYVDEWGWPIALSVIRAVLNHIRAYNKKAWDNGMDDLNVENTIITYVRGRDGQTYLVLSYLEAQAFAKGLREVRTLSDSLVDLAEDLEEEKRVKFVEMLDREVELTERVKQRSRRSSSG